MFPDNLARIIVFTQSEKTEVPEMADLRFILHLFFSYMNLRANSNLSSVEMISGT